MQNSQFTAGASYKTVQSVSGGTGGVVVPSEHMVSSRQTNTASGGRRTRGLTEANLIREKPKGAISNKQRYMNRRQRQLGVHSNDGALSTEEKH
jgi:hypothetical protein